MLFESAHCASASASNGGLCDFYQYMLLAESCTCETLLDYRLMLASAACKVLLTQLV